MKFPEALGGALLRRLLLLLLTTLLSLLLAEVALRFFEVDTEIRLSLKRGGLVQPYRALCEAQLTSPDFVVSYRINEYGLRDPRGRQLARSPGQRRWLLLGDSFSEGYGVSVAERFGQRLEGRSSELEVWNLGRMGSSPLFYVLQLRVWLARLQPELVLVQLFDNDLQENDYRRLRFDERGRVLALPAELEPRGSALFDIEALSLTRHLRRAQRKLRGRRLPRLFVAAGRQATRPTSAPDSGAGPRFPWYDPGQRAHFEPLFARHEQLLRQLIEEHRRRLDAPPVVFLYIPDRDAFDLGSGAEELRAANPHAQLVAKVCADTGVPLIDATEILLEVSEDPKALYYPNDLHWTTEAHEQVARALWPRLAKLVERR